jgi:hypothetical protein
LTKLLDHDCYFIIKPVDHTEYNEQCNKQQQVIARNKANKIETDNNTRFEKLKKQKERNVNELNDAITSETLSTNVQNNLPATENRMPIHDRNQSNLDNSN